MDRSVDVRTPESIAFTYELAGLGSRFLALAVDQLIQLTIIGALLVGVTLVFGSAPGRRVVEAFSGKVAESIAFALMVTLLFAILIGYFILFETIWNGQTPGKRLLGIRVVRDGGYPIDFGASLIRNLIRIGEQLLGYYILAAISALASHENKRLGDFAAGTIVVRDARLAAPSQRAPAADEPSYAPTAYLSGDERAIVKRFLDRRDRLTAQRRAELAAQLAARVRARVPIELQRLDDEALIERL